jgi:hypothetical protein
MPTCQDVLRCNRIHIDQLHNRDEFDFRSRDQHTLRSRPKLKRLLFAFVSLPVQMLHSLNSPTVQFHLAALRPLSELAQRSLLHTFCACLINTDLGRIAQQLCSCRVYALLLTISGFDIVTSRRTIAVAASTCPHSIYRLFQLYLKNAFPIRFLDNYLATPRCVWPNERTRFQRNSPLRHCLSLIPRFYYKLDFILTPSFNNLFEITFVHVHAPRKHRVSFSAGEPSGSFLLPRIS